MNEIVKQELTDYLSALYPGKRIEFASHWDAAIEPDDWPELLVDLQRCNRRLRGRLGLLWRLWYRMLP